MGSEMCIRDRVEQVAESRVHEEDDVAAVAAAGRQLEVVVRRPPQPRALALFGQRDDLCVIFADSNSIYRTLELPLANFRGRILSDIDSNFAIKYFFHDKINES